MPALGAALQSIPQSISSSARTARMQSDAAEGLGGGTVDFFVGYGVDRFVSGMADHLSAHEGLSSRGVAREGTAPALNPSGDLQASASLQADPQKRGSSFLIHSADDGVPFDSGTNSVNPTKPSKQTGGIHAWR